MCTTLNEGPISHSAYVVAWSGYLSFLHQLPEAMYIDLKGILVTIFAVGLALQVKELKKLAV